MSNSAGLTPTGLNSDTSLLVISILCFHRCEVVLFSTLSGGCKMWLDELNMAELPRCLAMFVLCAHWMLIVLWTDMQARANSVIRDPLSRCLLCSCCGNRNT